MNPILKGSQTFATLRSLAMHLFLERGKGGKNFLCKDIFADLDSYKGGKTSLESCVPLDVTSRSLSFSKSLCSLFFFSFVF